MPIDRSCQKQAQQGFGIDRTGRPIDHRPEPPLGSVYPLPQPIAQADGDKGDNYDSENIRPQATTPKIDGAPLLTQKAPPKRRPR